MESNARLTSCEERPPADPANSAFAMEGWAPVAGHDSASPPVLSVTRDPVRSFATRPDRALLVLLQAELALSGTWKRVPRRRVRVPRDTFVPVMPTTSRTSAQGIGRRATSPEAVRGRQGVSEPVPARPAASRKAAYVLREAVMLALFVATLAATYYLGRANAFQNVIIVPEPWNRHSEVS